MGKTFIRFKESLSEAWNVFENLETCIKRLFEERQDAIIHTARIVEYFHDNVFNVSSVRFKDPIEINWIDFDNDAEFHCDTITEIYCCGMFEYAVMDDGDVEISIEYLTAESLKLIYEEMPNGTWSVCLYDSDDDFEDMSFEEMREIRKEESDKRYEMHCNQ